MKKLTLVTTTVIGGSGVKYSRTEVRTGETRKGRPAFKQHGAMRNGLPIAKRTEKFYSTLAWTMGRGGAR